MTSNPGTILGNLAYEIVDGGILQTRSGVVLKSTANLRIDSVIGIDVVRTVKSTVLGLGSADLVFRDSGGASKFVWQNVPQAEVVRDYILALRDNPSNWEREEEDVTPMNEKMPQVPPALLVARQSHQTDFGNGSIRLADGPPRAMNAKIYLAATPEWIEKDVQWTYNGDGTVTDPVNELMWIGAPWGMVWDGKRFTGDPILLTWMEATELFGRGEVWLDRSEEHAVAFTEKERTSTGIDFGYRKGTCKVHFAGFDDWRLPTVADASFFPPGRQANDQDGVPGWPFGKYWTATGCKKYISLVVHKNPVAWCRSIESFVDEHSDYRFAVAFVRNTNRQ